MLIRELAVLLTANIPLITALDILSQQYPDKIQKIMISIRKDISDGSSLSQSLKKHPKYFDLLTIHIIKAGEESAALPQILDNIAGYQEKIALLKTRLKKALFYPLTVLFLALLITIGLLIFIVPQFESLFESMGAQLPLVTRIVLSLAGFMKTKGLILIVFLLLLIITLVLSKKYFVKFSEILSYLFLSLPIIGNIYQKIIFSRFSHTLAILLNASIPLTEALKISANVIAHKKYERSVIQARENIIKGDALSHALEKSQLFPFIFIQFIYIGEQSGRLSEMLTKLAERYETESDHILQALTLLLEPAIMLILGILIGGLVIAMYLPVFELGKIV